MQRKYSNSYLAKIFPEHPIASWSLDDNNHYISLYKNYLSQMSLTNVEQGFQQSVASVYSDSFTLSPFSGDINIADVVNYSGIAGPYSSEKYHKITYQNITASGIYKRRYITVLESPVSFVDNEKLTLSGLVNLMLDSSYVNESITANSFGIFFAKSTPTGYKIIEENKINILEQKYFDWYSPQIILDFEGTADNEQVYLGFYVEITGQSSGDFGVYVNNLDIGKFVNQGMLDGPGETIVGISEDPLAKDMVTYLSRFNELPGQQIENEVGFMKAHPAGYEQNDFGYYFVEKYQDKTLSKLMANNSAMPIVYGSESSCNISRSNFYFDYDFDVDMAAVVLPGKSFLHESGNGNQFTFEFWAKIDPNHYFMHQDKNSDIDSRTSKIFGPLDSRSGIYVDSTNIYLRVNDKIASHFVGNMNRPLLIHWSYDQALHYLFINGEQVLSLEYNDSDLIDADGLDYVGFFGNKMLSYNVDCASVFPYKINEVIAKRRFVYGQGVQSLNIIAESFSGTAVVADFANSNYYNNLSFPETLKWESGYRSNVIIKDGKLGLPEYSLPDLVFSSNKNSNGVDISTIPKYSQYKKDMQSILQADFPSGVVQVDPRLPYFNMLANKGRSTQNINIDYSQLYSTLLFDNFSVIDARVKSIIFDLQIPDVIESGIPKSIFRITKSDGSYVYSNITITLKNGVYSCSISVRYFNVSTDQDVLLYSNDLTVLPNNRIKVFFDIDKIIYQNQPLSQNIARFFSNPADLTLNMLGTDSSNTYTGKVYAITFNNSLFTEKLYKELFPTVPYAQPLRILNIPVSDIKRFIEPEIGSYTLKPNWGEGIFNLDVASSGRWEVYLPASSFYKTSNSERGDQFFDTGSIQVNFDGGSPKYQYSEYSENLNPREISCRVAIVDSTNYGDTTYSPDISLDVFNFIDQEDFDSNVELNVSDNSIINIPESFKEGENYLRVALDITSFSGIKTKPISMKYLQLATLPTKKNYFDFNKINSRFGSPVYPVSKFGDDINTPRSFAGSVDIFYNQYLYNSKNSGYSYYESNPSYQLEEWLSSSLYKKRLSGFMFRFAEVDSEIKSTGLTMSLMMNDYFPELTGAVKFLSDENKFVIKLGELILATQEQQKYNIVAYKLTSENTSADFNKNTRWLVKLVDDEGNENTDFVFYQNGKATRNIVLTPMEWTHMSIVIRGGYTLSSYNSYILASNCLSLNNITFNELGSQARDINLIQNWTSILYNEDYTATRDWQYWQNNDNTWSDLLYVSVTGTEYLNANQYFNILCGQNVIYSEDDVFFDNIDIAESTEANVITEVSWQNYVLIR